MLSTVSKFTNFVSSILSKFTDLGASSVLGQHDSNLLVAFSAGEVEWGASLLGPSLNVGRTGEEQLGKLREPLLSGKGQRTLPAVGERGDGVAAVVEEKLYNINVVLTASLSVHTRYMCMYDTLFLVM